MDTDGIFLNGDDDGEAAAAAAELDRLLAALDEELQRQQEGRRQESKSNIAASSFWITVILGIFVPLFLYVGRRYYNSRMRKAPSNDKERDWLRRQRAARLTSASMASSKGTTTTPNDIGAPLSSMPIDGDGGISGDGGVCDPMQSEKEPIDVHNVTVPKHELSRGLDANGSHAEGVENEEPPKKRHATVTAANRAGKEESSSSSSSSMATSPTNKGIIAESATTRSASTGTAPPSAATTRGEVPEDTGKRLGSDNVPTKTHQLSPPRKQTAPANIIIPSKKVKDDAAVSPSMDVSASISEQESNQSTSVTRTHAEEPMLKKAKTSDTVPPATQQEATKKQKKRTKTHRPAQIMVEVFSKIVQHSIHLQNAGCEEQTLQPRNVLGTWKPGFTLVDCKKLMPIPSSNDNILTWQMFLDKCIVPTLADGDDEGNGNGSMKNSNSTLMFSKNAPSSFWDSITSHVLQKTPTTQEQTIPMNHAIGMVSRAQGIARDGFAPYIVPSDNTDGWKELKALLTNFSTWLCQHHIGPALEKDLKRMIENDQTEQLLEEDDDDLFASDDFQTDHTSTSSTTPNLDSFLAILNTTPTIMTSTFFALLNSIYCKLQQETDSARVIELGPNLLLAEHLTTVMFHKRRISDNLMGISQLLQLLPTSITALLQRMKRETAAAEKDARANSNGNNGWEASSRFAPLFIMAAYALANAGEERPSTRTPSSRSSSDHRTAIRTKSTKNKSKFQLELEQVPQYPICYYNRSKEEQQRHRRRIPGDPYGDGNSLSSALRQSRLVMQKARQTAIVVLKKVASKDRNALFQWIKLGVVGPNALLVDIPRAQLLDIHPQFSTRRFLLGLTTSLIGLCGESLVKRGWHEYTSDYIYQNEWNPFRDISKPLLVRSSAYSGKDDGGKTKSAKKDLQVSGGTEFFFLSMYLLRLSLYPVLRVEKQLLQQQSQFRSLLGKLPPQASTLPLGLLEQVSPLTGAVLGFEAIFLDSELIRQFTKMVLLQMQWVRDLSKSKEGLDCIPDWVCKESSVWLARVAGLYPPQFTPTQAEQSVECATEMLQYGTSTPSKAFSPVVLHLLVKIISDFVRAGANRARHTNRKRLQNNRDDVSIYTSFDKHNIGVTVYTNRLVCTVLGPALIGTFSALDIVEGLDVDREHSFDKFQAKLDIVDLMLRLWSHPNGECRRSIVELPEQTLAKFGKSVSAAIGYLLDDSLNKIADISASRKDKRPTARSTFRDTGLDGLMRGAASGAHAGRMLLLLLSRMSEDDRPAKAFGNSGKDLAVMIAHFIDLSTDEDGGLNESLDGRVSKERSSQLATQCSDMSVDERTAKATELFEDRYFLFNSIGFNASRLCHHLLALGARWNQAAKSTESTSSTNLVSSLAANDDYDNGRYRNIFLRLLSETDEDAVAGAIKDNVEQIFEADGWLGFSVWGSAIDREAMQGGDPRAEMDQLSVTELNGVASQDDISAFLDELEREHQAVESKSKIANVNLEDLTTAEAAVLSHPAKLTETEYGEHLSGWLVSSESFTSKTGAKSFAHYYGNTASSQAVTSSGKVLVKEARRCHKNLPVPHPNSAAFVCFAEERMDLCRAIITGPVDTPYAYGIFCFDVFFPATYPQIPPLATFMTTGGGQTRFNPNLYQDGKVCLSLLNTWHAADNSQKWNPALSSLAQILLSIQTQLLTEEPYFNEPGYERRRGTTEGKVGSTRYNANLRLATLRHAILSPLQEPPVGFEEVTKRHFSMCRYRMLAQARRWMLEARADGVSSKTTVRRFERAYQDLVVSLQKAYLDEENGKAHRLDSKYDPLPPTNDDLKALIKLGDRDFVSRHFMSYLGEEKKRPANSSFALTSNQSRQVEGRVHRTEAPAGRVRGNFGRGMAGEDELSVVAMSCIIGSAILNNPWNGFGLGMPEQEKSSSQGEDEELYL